MRLAIVSALVLAGSAAAAVVFACGGDTTTTMPSASDAGMSETSTAPSADGGHPPLTPEQIDAGFVYAPPPDNCLIITTDYLVGGKVENVARPDVPDAVDWTDLDNALAVDEKVASVTLAEGQESASLTVSEFKIALPSTALTYGIEIELKRRAPDGGIADAKVEVAIEGKVTRFKFIATPWPSKIIGTHDYGQQIDTWGVDLQPADVDKPTFAAKISAKRNADAVGPVTATIDAVRVAVHYCK